MPLSPLPPEELGLESRISRAVHPLVECKILPYTGVVEVSCVCLQRKESLVLCVFISAGEKYLNPEVLFSFPSVLDF